MSKEFNDHRTIFIRNRVGKLKKVKSYVRRSYADKCISELVYQGETVFVKYVQGGEFSSNRYNPIWYYHLRRSDGTLSSGEVASPYVVKELVEADGAS